VPWSDSDRCDRRHLGLVHQSRLTLLSSKEVAVDMIVKLTSVSMMPAVVFGDPEEMARRRQQSRAEP
jgi:hypothetical protein